MAWQIAKDSYEKGKATFTEGLGAAVSQLQDMTGLKFREVFGWSREMYSTAESKGKELARAAEQKLESAKKYVEEKVEEVKK